MSHGYCLVSIIMLISEVSPR